MIRFLRDLFFPKAYDFSSRGKRSSAVRSVPQPEGSAAPDPATASAAAREA